MSEIVCISSASFFLATSYCHNALFQTQTRMPMFLQAKEAGADDVLDISACELTEVNYTNPNE